MEIIAYLAAVVIGISLGLMGGGGSILTVPVMVYLLGVNPVLSTAYSLFVVGMAALMGTINNLRKGLVSVKMAIIFAIPAFIAVYLTRLYLVPSIPENIVQIADFVLTKDMAIMIFFAIVMFLAAISMIRSGIKKVETVAENEATTNYTYNYPLIILEGGVVGVLTGIVGAGGGFLIIPALVLLARLPMKLAVGTSLFIIAIKSIIGFIGDVQAGYAIDWWFLSTFTICAMIGILVGGYLANFISGKKLKIGFGWFVLFMALFILIKELSRK